MKINNILKNFDLIQDKEIAKLEEINFKYPFFRLVKYFFQKAYLILKVLDMMNRLKKPPHILEIEKNFFTYYE